MKTYQVTVDIVCTFLYEDIKAKDWKTAQTIAENKAMKEFEDGATDYPDVSSEVSEMYP